MNSNTSNSPILHSSFFQKKEAEKLFEMKIASVDPEFIQWKNL